MLSSIAVGDSNRDGIPEVYIADLEGKVYGWNAGGQRIFTEESNIAYSGKPLAPFQNVRYEPGPARFPPYAARLHRLARVRQPRQRRRAELVAAAMDRHLYAWDDDDSSPNSPGGAQQSSGYPVLVVDPDKLATSRSTADTCGSFDPEIGFNKTPRRRSMTSTRGHHRHSGAGLHRRRRPDRGKRDPGAGRRHQRAVRRADRTPPISRNTAFFPPTGDTANRARQLAPLRAPCRGRRRR